MPSNRGVFTLSRQMWEKELSDHHKKVNVAKAVVPGQMANGQGATATPRRPPVASGSSGAAAAAGGRASTGKAGAGTGDERPDGIGAPTRCLDGLPSTDRRTCDDVITVLEKMSSAESKVLLEEIFVTSEMRKLLSRYTGVYPSLAPQQDEADEEEAAVRKEKIKAKAGEVQKPAPPPEKKAEASSGRRQSGSGTYNSSSGTQPAATKAAASDRTTPPPAAAQDALAASAKKEASVVTPAKSVQSAASPVGTPAVTPAKSFTASPNKEETALSTKKAPVPAFLKDDDAEEEHEEDEEYEAES